METTRQLESSPPLEGPRGHEPQLAGNTMTYLEKHPLVPLLFRVQQGSPEQILPYKGISLGLKCFAGSEVSSPGRVKCPGVGWDDFLKPRETQPENPTSFFLEVAPEVPFDDAASPILGLARAAGSIPVPAQALPALTLHTP